MKKVTKFIFDRAHYIIEDNTGSRVRLRMNYKKNTYSVDGTESELARKIATELLRKKHDVNFAYKFAQYTLE